MAYHFVVDPPLLTESEARARRCPYNLVGACMAHACMAWQRAMKTDGESVPSESERGYCRLINPEPNRVRQGEY